MSLLSELSQRVTLCLSKLPLWAWVVFALALVVLGRGAYVQSQIKKLDQVFMQAPGYFVSDISYKNARYHVLGLKDPQAASLEDVLKYTDFNQEDVLLKVKPYASLEAALVIKAIEKAIGVPAKVAFDMDGYALVVSGEASANWRDQAIAYASQLPPYINLDVSRLQLDQDDLQAQISSLLDLDAYEVTMSIDGRSISFSGSVPKRWLASAKDKLAAFDTQGRHVNFDQLVIGRHALKSLLQDIGQYTIYFSGGTRWPPSESIKLNEFAMRAKEAMKEAMDLNYTFELNVIGLTDGVGSFDRNTSLQLERARAVRNALEARGVPKRVMSLGTSGGEAGSQNLNQRRAQFYIRVLDQNGNEVSF